MEDEEVKQLVDLRASLPANHVRTIEHHKGCLQPEDPNTTFGHIPASFQSLLTNGPNLSHIDLVTELTDYAMLAHDVHLLMCPSRATKKGLKPAHQHIRLHVFIL